MDVNAHVVIQIGVPTRNVLTLETMMMLFDFEDSVKTMMMLFDLNDDDDDNAL